MSASLDWLLRLIPYTHTRTHSQSEIPTNLRTTQLSYPVTLYTRITAFPKANRPGEGPRSFGEILAKKVLILRPYKYTHTHTHGSYRTQLMTFRNQQQKTGVKNRTKVKVNVDLYSTLSSTHL